jgi:hypothetical protein
MPCHHRTACVAIALLGLLAGVVPAQTLPAAAPAPLREGSDLFDCSNLGIAIELGAAALVARSVEDHDAIAARLDNWWFEFGLDVGNRWGEGATMGLTALTLYGVGAWSGDARTQDAGHDLILALLRAWTVTSVLKVTIDAERPNGARYSFPSGHTATAWAAAPVLSEHYGPYVGAGAYTLAVLTGMARMEEHKHYLGDVIAGAAIGLISGRISTLGVEPAATLPDGRTGLAYSHGF